MSEMSLDQATRRISDLERKLADVEEDFESTMTEFLGSAQLRAQRLADELLTATIDIVGLSGSSRDELDVAIEVLRSRADEHGLLRRRPPRSVK